MMKNIFKGNKKKFLICIKITPEMSKNSYSSMRITHAEDIDYRFLRDKFLEKYGLTNLKLVWPDNNDTSNNIDYIKKNPNTIEEMYGNADLSKLPIFQGGFINFGYWPKQFLSNDTNITIEQRIASSKEMYKVVGSLAGILKNYNILDVGCGLGYGTSYLSEHFQPKLAVGIDISLQQVERTLKCQAAGIKAGKLRFAFGEAKSMPFPDRGFDCIVSVEAAQHFDSISAFAKEGIRILKPGGKLVFTSFFPTNDEGVEALNAIIPNYHIHGSQNTIKDIKMELSEHMENVKIKSIGENVWYGLSRWLDQIGYHNQWSKIWCALYEKKLIDYVVYEATSPIMDIQELKQEEYQSTNVLK